MFNAFNNSYFRAADNTSGQKQNNPTVFPTNPNLPTEQYPDITSHFDDAKYNMYQNLVNTHHWNTPEGITGLFREKLRPNGPWDLSSQPQFPGISSEGKTEYAKLRDTVVTGDFLNHHLLGHGIAGASLSLTGDDPEKTVSPQQFPEGIWDFHAVQSGYRKYMGDPGWKDGLRSETKIVYDPTGDDKPFQMLNQYNDYQAQQDRRREESLAHQQRLRDAYSQEQLQKTFGPDLKTAAFQYGMRQTAGPFLYGMQNVGNNLKRTLGLPADPNQSPPPPTMQEESLGAYHPYYRFGGNQGMNKAINYALGMPIQTQTYPGGFITGQVTNQINNQVKKQGQAGSQYSRYSPYGDFQK